MKKKPFLQRKMIIILNISNDESFHTPLGGCTHVLQRPSDWKQENMPQSELHLFFCVPRSYLFLIPSHLFLSQTPATFYHLLF